MHTHSVEKKLNVMGAMSLSIDKYITDDVVYIVLDSFLISLLLKSMILLLWYLSSSFCRARVAKWHHQTSLRQGNCDRFDDVA